MCSIPGVLAACPSHADMLKQPQWCAILSHLKERGDRIMIDLLLDCAIFVPVDGDGGNYYQISGMPISMVKPKESQSISNGRPSSSSTTSNKPSNVKFVRSRMFYNQPALNARGEVRFGLRHIHVFNRYSDASKIEHTIHVMKYIFPRHFGLHNVFTSKVDSRETTQPFKDYTLREKEITGTSNKLPKRLRGLCFDMIQQLQRRHYRCSYVELLRHYCPTENPEESEGRSITDMATEYAHVSAFSRAVLRSLIPKSFFGIPESDDALHNERHLGAFVDKFIRLRKYESLTLHDLLQGFKISSMPWLQPPNVVQDDNLSRTDFVARQILLAEALYFVIDGILIPLLRSNFHITESNAHRNRLFYFRHDVWRQLTEPALLELKSGMFQEQMATRSSRTSMTLTEAKAAARGPNASASGGTKLGSTAFGSATVRLLPKANSFRLVTNLRRRAPINRGGRTVLGRSINSLLKPVFDVLNLEKSNQPNRMGSTILHISDILPRLKAYRQRLRSLGWAQGQQLWFAKVDVNRCFDTIPQDKVMQLLECLIAQPGYHVGRYAEVRAPAMASYGDEENASKRPQAKYATYSKSSTSREDFSIVVEKDLAPGRRGTVFLPSGAPTLESRARALNLLRQHITQHTIKFDKKVYRQSTGIPQGSVVSSLICNFFYAWFEAEKLRWLVERDDSCLFRLVDDFLVISSDRNAVERFVGQMHKGDAEFGVQVKTSKTALNFDMSFEGKGMQVVSGAFPYCGMEIDSTVLDVRKAGRKTSDGEWPVIWKPTHVDTMSRFS